MLAQVEYAEYLAEVREQVCGHCPEWAPDRPPYCLRCLHCGVRLQLPRLVESIHEAEGWLGGADTVPDRREVCARCAGLEGSNGLCPAGPHLDLLVGAVESVDERREQRELVRRRVSRQLHRERIPVVEMIRAYEEATGTYVGCD